VDELGHLLNIVMRNIVFTILMAGMFLGYSCAPKATARTGKKPAVEEDLSVYRPKYEVATSAPQNLPANASKLKEYPEPSFDLTAQINALLDTVAERNQRVNYVQGYTILIRGGQLEEARNIRQRIMNMLPDTNPELTFDRPIYKVKVGRFYSKIEANRLYLKIKEEFPNRVILAPEIIYLY
jgi:hypothetical protein